MATELIHQAFQALAIIFCRILPLFLIIPVFTSSILSNMTVRGTFILIFSLPMTTILHIPDAGFESPYEMLFNEFVIGLFIAIPAAVPFWIANSIGEMIDNQRGATLSNSIDPSIGVEASPLSTFFLYFTNVLFLTSPGILLLIQSVYDSYKTFPFSEKIDILSLDYDLLFTLIDKSLLAGIIFTLPILLFMFITEVFLGILSRFSPQMNSFSLSLTVKSFIGISVLFLYFSKIYPNYIMGFFQYVKY